MAVRTQAFIPADWKRWIAENVLKNNDTKQLHSILCAQGFDSELAQLEIDTARQHPYLEAAKSVARQVEKRDWVLHTNRMLRELDGGMEVRVLSDVTTEQFLHEFYRTNTPVILKNCLDEWPALKRWTADYLKRTCGQYEVEVQTGRESNTDFEREPGRHRSTMPFSELVDVCFGTQATNDVYMTARNGRANGEILDSLWEDMGTLPQYLNPERAKTGYFFWFGPKGTITPLHHDLTNNFMAQVVGSKKLYLIAPEYQPYVYNHFHCYSKLRLPDVNTEEFPLFDQISVQEIVIEAGDLLFLPVGWWHRVEGLETSITITCTNFRWINTFDGHYTTLGEI